MGSNGRHRWNPFRNRFLSSSSSSKKHQNPPKEFLCPISGSLMSEPVVVSSGQTFERAVVQACIDLGFVPVLEDGSKPDFSAVIPNLNMKSTIFSWCKRFGTQPPEPPDYAAVEEILRSRMSKGESEIRVSEKELLRAVAEQSPAAVGHHADTEIINRQTSPENLSGSSEESVIVGPPSPFTPYPLATRPACFSPSSKSSSSEISAEIETLAQKFFFSSSTSTSTEEEEIHSRLTSPDIFDHEQALILMRKMTRTKIEIRVSFCTPRILTLLRDFIVSRYNLVQINALASLVNLSLEKKNKVTIVRSGLVPLLIDVLKSGSIEAQEHAAGAIFSLALEDDNKIPIAVLGALQPLLHALRAAESDRARQDSALALYHLSLSETNRSKLVRLGAVPTLLSMVRSGDSASRVLLVICNLAASGEGRAAMLDANAVEILVGKLREGRTESETATENCVAALYALSYGNQRFKRLAKEARAMDALKEVEEVGTERAREKIKKILQMMREKNPEEEEENGDEMLDWDGVVDSNGLTRNRYRVKRNVADSPNSSVF